MRKKFGTLLDTRLIRQLKGVAAKEGTALNELLERALWNYFEVGPSGSSFGQSFSKRTQGSLKISKKDLKTILEEDLYDV